MLNVLIVEDNAICSGILRKLLEPSYTLFSAETLTDAFLLLARHDIDLVLLDLHLPDTGGISTVSSVREKHPSLPIIVITEEEKPDVIVETMKLGAKDYIVKNRMYDNGSILLEKTANVLAPIREYKISRAKSFQIVQNNNKYFLPPMERYQDMFNRAKTALQGGLSLLVTGESGTGKGMLISTLSATYFQDKPLITVDCGSIVSSLAESELFGHVKGSFTGAVQDKPGKIELADNGFLFLDEIHNAPVEVQVKLLRILQEKKFSKVGSTKEQSVSFSLITATNKDLKAEIANGRFKEDLYYRIRQDEIHLPSLRDDNAVLTEYINYFVDFYNKKYRTEFAQSAMFKEHMNARPFFGNIRELDAEIQKMIYAHSIGEDWTMYVYTAGPLHSAKTDTPAEPASPRDKFYDDEKKTLLAVLQKHCFKIARAAKELGIPRTTLHSKMKKYGID